MSGRIPDHRVHVPVSFQDWEHLTFLHWPYDAATVQALVPDPLRVQEWDGVTWVGVTPFRMARVRAPALPPPPGWDLFGELNVRAYVRAPNGRDGIWFLGMVVPRLSFVLALGSLGLPYRRSRAGVDICGSRWGYRFGTPRWQHPPDDDWFHASVTVGGPLPSGQRTPLVDSITGRWWAFHQRAGVLWRTPVEHEPWSLRTAAATGDLTRPLLWAGLPEPNQPPLVHASLGVNTRLGVPRPALLGR